MATNVCFVLTFGEKGSLSELIVSSNNGTRPSENTISSSSLFALTPTLACFFLSPFLVLNPSCPSRLEDTNALYSTPLRSAQLNSTPLRLVFLIIAHSFPFPSLLIYRSEYSLNRTEHSSRCRHVKTNFPSLRCTVRGGK